MSSSSDLSTTSAAPADERDPPREVLRSVDVAVRLQLALDAGDLGTWHWDRRTGRTTWDANLERLYGFEPGSFPATFDDWLDLLHPEDRDQVMATINEAVRTRSPYQIEHRVVRPDGAVRWMQGRGTVVLDDHGAVTGTIGCVGDITPRKQAELDARSQAREAHQRAERERRQRERLEFLAGITRSSLRAKDHRDLMDIVTRTAVPDLGDWCAIYFLPEPGAPPEVAVAHADPEKMAWAARVAELHPGDPTTRVDLPEVIRTGRTSFFPVVGDALIEVAARGTGLDVDAAREILRSLDLTSVITVPLISKRGVLGAMRFVTAESGRRYEREDVALAEAAAGRIAEALDNLWLTDQQRHIAATLQQALLPAELPEIPHLDIAARYWPAGTVDVGGDFYDVFSLGPDRTAVVIGDVCGTGPDPAAVTGIARHTIRAAATHGHDHRSVLDWVNLAVRESGRGLFCTACYSTVESDSSGLHFVSTVGGHPLPVVVRTDGSSETVGEPGTLLGVLPELRTAVSTTPLGPGDTVLLYTDGITDVPPPHGLEAPEVAELFAKAVGAADDSAESVADEVRRAVDARLPMERRTDDVALVVVRVRDA